MSRRSSPGRAQLSIFQQQDRCTACAGSRLCGAVETTDACGDPVEYRPGGLTVESAPNMTEDELRLPADVEWPALPALGASLVIGTSFGSAGCDAVRLKEVLARARQAGGTDHFRGRVIVLHGSDHQLLRLGGQDGAIARVLGHRGAAAVIGPGFSTWWDWTPFESLVAMARSAGVAAQLARVTPTVPTIVWRNEHDLARWAAWIRETRPGAVAVDLGTARSPARWAWALRGIACLAQQLDAGTALRLIANGPSTIDRMAAVRAAWRSDLTFASQNPWQLAQGGKRLLENLEVVPDSVPRPELEQVNREAFERAAEQIVVAGPASGRRLRRVV
jgi:hypothetical protein